MTMHITVLGLGAMGSRMASRLLAGRHDVTVFNRTPDAAAPLVERGARRASTPREAVEACEIAIACVRDDAASRDVWLDPRHGALAGLPADAIAIESSTLSYGWARELGATMAGAAVSFLDAPVVGSRPQADSGQLLHLVGGDAGVLETVRGVLLQMGAAVHHTGPVGSATAMKLAVNALFGIQVAALAEVLALLRNAGIEETDAIETLSYMPTASPALKGIGALMAKRTFEPLFPIELVEKDFGYLVETAARVSTKVPAAAAMREVYRGAIDAGFGADNIHGVLQVFD